MGELSGHNNYKITNKTPIIDIAFFTGTFEEF